MLLVKMLMEIYPLPMTGSMVMISPSRRDVSPVEQLHRSPRLVPPRFRLMAAEFCPISLLIIFPSTKDSVGGNDTYGITRIPTMVSGARGREKSGSNR